MGMTELLAGIAQQERDLAFPAFDENVAWSLGCHIREWAQAARWPIVIDVRYFHRPLFFAALPGSTPDNAEWVRRKANVVQRFHRSSFAMGLEMSAKETTLEKRYGLPRLDFAEYGGAFPIIVSGTGTIGCLTVSGLPQRQDHMLTVRALCAIQTKEFSDYALPETA